MFKEQLKIILCVFLRIIIKLLNLFFTTKDFSPLKNSKILIISIEGIGNTILSIPLIYALKKNLENGEVHVLTTTISHKSILEGTKCIDNTIPYDKKIIKRIKLFIKLRRSHYDYCFLSFPTLSLPKEIIPFIIKSRYNVCHNYEKIHKYFIYIKDIYHQLIEIEDQLHDVEQNLNLLRNFELASTTLNKYPPFYFSKIANENIAIFLKNNGLDENDLLVAIHPGSSKGAFYKRWPFMNFIALAELLKTNLNANIIFIIGPDEVDIKEHIIHNHFFVYQSHHIENVAFLLSKCKYFISNDSGIMHLASLVNVPIFTIWGGTNERRNGAWGLDVTNIINNDMNCRPCVNFLPDYPCENKSYDCITGISVEKVYQHIQNKMSVL